MELMHSISSAWRLIASPAVAVAAVLAVADLSGPVAGQTPAPNIVIIMADDLGFGDLGCFGHPITQTPNLDQLADDGVRFTSFYAGHATCSPSRAAMMTGRTPFRSSIFTFIPRESCVHLRSREVTLAEICKTVGYDTAFVGKWGLVGDMEDDTQPSPAEQGFDYWFATQNNALPSHDSPENFYDEGGAVGETDGYSSQIVVDKALKWLADRPDKLRPFLLVLWFHEPHIALAQPESFTANYDQHPPLEALYYGNVEHLDFQVGRLLKGLDGEGGRENTWITFTSDNGPKHSAGGRSGGLRGAKASFN
ncbi:MAG: sulfatase-like hydrolase/transferase [Planctomycetota bacterium]